LHEFDFVTIGIFTVMSAALAAQAGAWIHANFITIELAEKHGREIKCGALHHRRFVR
jgi:hypothetical protein